MRGPKQSSFPQKAGGFKNFLEKIAKNLSLKFHKIELICRVLSFFRILQKIIGNFSSKVNFNNIEQINKIPEAFDKFLTKKDKKITRNELCRRSGRELPDAGEFFDFTSFFS